MAFTPDTLSTVVQSIGGAGIRMFTYQTDDSIDTVTGTDYFASAKGRGLRVSDIIFVSPIDAVFEPFTLVIETVDAAGNATATISLADINGVFYAQTRAEIKALRTRLHKAAYLTEAGREGQFIFRAGDYSAEITADTLEGIYIKATDTAASAGAWVRQDGWTLSGLSVLWFGAKGDGVTDDTAAFKAARDVAYATGVRKVVVPSVDADLFYLMNDEWLFNYGIEVVGAGWSPYIVFGTSGQRGAGSWIKVNDPTKAGIRVARDGTNLCSGVHITGLAFLWDQAAPGVDWVPTPTEYGIRFEGTDDCKLTNILLLNPEYGLIQTGSLEAPSGRLDIDGLFGQPLRLGINCDFSADVGRWNNIHFWPWWSMDENVFAFQKTNATFFRSARNDNMQATNWFSYAYGTGMLFEGNVSGITSRFKGVNIEHDACLRPLSIPVSGESSTGQITNLSAVMDVDPVSGGIVVQAQEVRFELVNYRGTNSASYAASVEGIGSHLTFISPHLEDWDRANLGFPAFSATSNGRITVVAPKFINRLAYPLLKREGNVDFDWASLYSTIEATGTLNGSGQAIVTTALGATIKDAKAYFLDTVGVWRPMVEDYVDGTNHVFSVSAVHSGKDYRYWAVNELSETA